MEIDEESFNAWKHHPVTKVYHRFLFDYEQELVLKLVGILRASETAPEPYQLGMFNGRSSAVREMATLEFSHIASFYSPPEQEEKQQEDQA